MTGRSASLETRRIRVAVSPWRGQLLAVCSLGRPWAVAALQNLSGGAQPDSPSNLHRAQNGEGSPAVRAVCPQQNQEGQMWGTGLWIPCICQIRAGFLLLLPFVCAHTSAPPSLSLYFVSLTNFSRLIYLLALESVLYPGLAARSPCCVPLGFLTRLRGNLIWAIYSGSMAS